MDPRFYEGEVIAAMPATYDKLKHKADIYLTAGRDVLVFRQPDQPYVGLQIPGGTVDPGESHLQAAMREFNEETGIELTCAFEFVADQIALFDNDAGCDVHCRRLYHGRLPAHAAINRQHRWEHFEMDPSGGGDPIRFDLFWLDIDRALRAAPSDFFTGFHAPLADVVECMARTS